MAELKLGISIIETNIGLKIIVNHIPRLVLPNYLKNKTLKIFNLRIVTIFISK